MTSRFILENMSTKLFKQFDTQTSENVKGKDGKITTKKVKDGADNKIDSQEFNNALNYFYKFSKSKQDADLYNKWLDMCAVQAPITDKNKFMELLCKALDKLDEFLGK